MLFIKEKSYILLIKMIKNIIDIVVTYIMFIISDIIRAQIPNPNNPRIKRDNVLIIIPVVVINVVCFILFNDINIDDIGPSRQKSMKNGASNLMYDEPSIVLNKSFSIGLLKIVIIVVKVIPIINERVIASIILFFNDFILLFLYNLAISGIKDWEIAVIKKDGTNNVWIV